MIYDSVEDPALLGIVNAWLYAPTRQPAIFDVFMGAVDVQHPWVRVRRRDVAALSRLGATSTTLLQEAMAIHPSARSPNAHGLHTINLREAEMLPQWVKARLAVLNIAAAGDWIRGVGKRWVTDNDRVHYTLEWACEGVKS